MAVETPSTPDPQSGAYGGVRQMTGHDGMAGASPSPVQADPAQMLAGVTSQLRQADQAVSEIARAFPQAAAEARRARSALRSLLQKVVSEPGGGAPAAPVGEV